MKAYILTRSLAIKQATQLLVEAGVIKPEEYTTYMAHLLTLDPKDLLAVLLEAWHLWTKSEYHINFYPIDKEGISNN